MSRVDEQVHGKPIARIGKLDSADITRLEHEMEKACSKLSPHPLP
jgi:hypothetical protein